MKKSHLVALALFGAFVAGMERCGGTQECVDANNVVVDDQYCRSATGGYHWFYTYSSPSAAGAHLDPASGTDRGVFGGAGDAAGHGGSGGE